VASPSVDIVDIAVDSWRDIAPANL
jgi:hypothetical protein